MIRIRDELNKLRGEGYFRDFEDKESYYLATCPFHSEGKEKTPSFSINKKRFRKNDFYVEEGYVHCFACGYKARITKFLADIRGVDEYDILKEARKNIIFAEKRDLNIIFEVEEQRVDIKMDECIDLQADGLQYLGHRKISKDVCKLFNIKQRNGQVVFPIYSKKGQVVATQGRSIVGKHFFNTENFEKMNYLYGLYELLQSEQSEGAIYVVESIIDCLTLWSWGFRAVALMGAKFSKVHIKELVKLPNEIVVATDNDVVGKQVAKDLVAELRAKGKKAKSLNWNGMIQKDINELSVDIFKKIKDR